jgi:hypothetical protein
VSLHIAQTAADRSVRRARAGLRDWHERQAAEDSAARGVAEWEARCSAGTVPDAKAEMEATMEGFRRAMADIESKWRALLPVRPMGIGVAL